MSVDLNSVHHTQLLADSIETKSKLPEQMITVGSGVPFGVTTFSGKPMTNFGKQTTPTLFLFLLLLLLLLFLLLLLLLLATVAFDNYFQFGQCAVLPLINGSSCGSSCERTASE